MSASGEASSVAPAASTSLAGCDVEICGLSGAFADTNGMRCKAIAWDEDTQKWRVKKPNGQTALMPEQCLQVVPMGSAALTPRGSSDVRDEDGEAHEVVSSSTLARGSADNDVSKEDGFIIGELVRCRDGPKCPWTISKVTGVEPLEVWCGFADRGRSWQYVQKLRQEVKDSLRAGIDAAPAPAPVSCSAEFDLAAQARGQRHRNTHSFEERLVEMRKFALMSKMARSPLLQDSYELDCRFAGSSLQSVRRGDRCVFQWVLRFSEGGLLVEEMSTKWPLPERGLPLPRAWDNLPQYLVNMQESANRNAASLQSKFDTKADITCAFLGHSPTDISDEPVYGQALSDSDLNLVELWKRHGPSGIDDIEYHLDGTSGSADHGIVLFKWTARVGTREVTVVQQKHLEVRLQYTFRLPYPPEITKQLQPLAILRLGPIHSNFGIQVWSGFFFHSTRIR